MKVASKGRGGGESRFWHGFRIGVGAFSYCSKFMTEKTAIFWQTKFTFGLYHV
jgi:hypothetical protein